MKNKDYVSESKGRRPKKAAKEPVKRPFPLLKVSIIALLIAGFGFFLHSIKGDGGEVVEPSTPPTTSSAKKSKALPPPPEDEEWQFIDVLENKQVEVEAEELEDKGPFKVPCGSFRDESQAQSLKAKIAFSGYESIVKTVEGKTGIWHRVELGPFEKKREAEKVRRTLKQAGINYCEIWLWR
jgi:cell division protein FtsN